MKSVLSLLLVFLTLPFCLKAQVPDFSFANSLGNSQADIGWATAVDGSGNSYVSGTFSDTLVIGSTSLIASGSGRDFFVLKYDYSGNLLWAKSFGGLIDDFAFDIAVDANDNIYLTGRFRYEIRINGTTYVANNSGTDAFVLKLDKDGNVIWFNHYGGPTTDVSNAIAVDVNANIYITGAFSTQMIAGNDTINSAGMEDVFVLKLNSNGSPAWLRGFGNTFGDIGRGIGVDANGNCYAAGSVRNRVSIGTKTIGSNGLWDAFLVKYDSNGNIVWARNAGGSDSEYAYDLVVTDSGNCYMVGSFMGNMFFGSISIQATSALYNEAFVAKYDSSGTAIWAKKIGGSDAEIAHSIDLDQDENSYVVGQFSSSSLTIDTTTLNNAGNGDAFLTALSPSGSFLWATQIGGTNSDVAFGVAVYKNEAVFTTGYFQDNIDFDPGTGTATMTSAGDYDVFLQKLQMCLPSSATDLISTCGPYTWIDGNTYSSSNNTATFTLRNAAGCDSVVLLDLTINSNTGVDSITACNSYTWIDGNTYTSSNYTATHTLTNSANCDSVVSLKLTIDGVSDLSTSLYGATITANNSNGSYQWLDCDNNAAIAGETRASYTASVSGIYAVEITENGCVDTSDCVAVTTSGFVENSFDERISVFPNPTKGKFALTFENTQEIITLRVLNLTGEELESRTISNTNELEMNLDQPAGLYLLEIQNASAEKAIYRLIKK